MAPLPRIAFCDTLRGLAAIVVMSAHYVHGFNGLHGWFHNPPGATDIYPAWFLRLFVVDGAFGVAIFFLVSGFVIPLSLRQRTAGGFLAARAVRLYPTYAACTAITLLLVILAGTESWGAPAVSKALHTVTFFRDWFGGLPFDAVVWTLEIEAKFYLYCALMLPLMRRHPGLVAVLPAMATTALLLAGVDPAYPVIGALRTGAPAVSIPQTALWNLGYLAFIGIGTLLHLRHAGLVTARFAWLAVTLSLLASLQFLHVRYAGNATVVVLYAAALAVFVFFFLYLRYWHTSATRFLSRVSYPLYAVHAAAGYLLLSLLIFRAGLHPLPALASTVAIVLAMAWALHRWVEAPTMRMAGQITALRGPRVSAPLRPGARA